MPMKMPVFLIRGIPGAGKSTFAKALKSALDSENLWALGKVFETDNFFVDLNSGEYKFDAKLLGVAHTWNQAEVYRFCRDNADAPCIVANSFTTLDELKEYQVIAAVMNRPVCVITMKTTHKNIHNVPEEALQKMRKRWMNRSSAFEIHSDSEVPVVISKIVNLLKDRL